MNDDNLKVTIKFPSLGKEVKTDTDTIQQLAKDLKNKQKRKKILKALNAPTQRQSRLMRKDMQGSTVLIVGKN